MLSNDFPQRTPIYRGRLAPSPTGFLHVGHARTFWIAQQRAESACGTLILRSDDLDHSRYRPEFVAAMMEDLRWFGLRWSEGPDVGGAFGPYVQSARMSGYLIAWEHLLAGGHIYPCTCSRGDVVRALSAPHVGDEEPIYPGTCRPSNTPRKSDDEEPESRRLRSVTKDPRRAGVSWRFRVPDGDVVAFHDAALGEQIQIAGRDFGDFLVWRKDDLPSYQLACTVDDAEMGVTEVVRGEDLITSTFRQLLLYRALGWEAPTFFHCQLVTDEHGRRLAKRDHARSLRELRAAGWTPESLRALYF